MRVLYRGARETRSLKAIADSWESRGRVVRIVNDYWRFSGKAKKGDLVFGGVNFCEVMAEKLGLTLFSPDNLWLKDLSWSWVKRSIKTSMISEINWPAFVKPLRHEAFPAGVFRDFQELKEKAWAPIEGTMCVFVSEPLEVLAEARAFVADGQVLDLCLYRGNRPREEALEFTMDFLKLSNFDSPCAVDSFYTKGNGWAVLEFNAPWASEIYTCRPSSVIDCLERAVTTNENNRLPENRTT